MRKLTVIIILLLATSSSYAQVAGGAISVRGSGNFSCGEYVRWSNFGNQVQLDIVNQWVWGFLVAYQGRATFVRPYVIPTVGNITNPDAGTIELYLKKYCSNEPLSNIHNAVIAMIRDLGGIVGNK